MEKSLYTIISKGNEYQYKNILADLRFGDFMGVTKNQNNSVIEYYEDGKTVKSFIKGFLTTQNEAKNWDTQYIKELNIPLDGGKVRKLHVYAPAITWEPSDEDDRFYGEVVSFDKKGNILGKHNGLYKYTIGQRKGLGISNPVPLFVIDFNKLKNELIVGEEKDLYKDSLLAADINWLVDNVKTGIKVNAKIRYAAEPKPAKIILLTKGYARVIFDEPQRAITPGQSVVFYDGDVVLGGGKILSH